MWNAALIFSNKWHGLQKKLLIEKNIFFCRYVKINELHDVTCNLSR